MSELLSVDTALERILADITIRSAQSVFTGSALARVLASDIDSEIMLPPFANSSMDGYAVRAEDIQVTPVELQVVMDIPAGRAPDGSIKAGQAARIMTGAPIPKGADSVVPVEQTDTTWAASDNVPVSPTVTILYSARQGDYVRQPGEDIQVGQRVLHKGHVLRPQDIGVLAGLGIMQVSVIRQPRVAIVSTGDELIDIDQPLAPGKVRDMNSYTLSGLVTQSGGIPIVIPKALDMLEDVRRAFRAAMETQPDIILSSAGVSVGTADMVRSVLEELGEIGFWKINLRPGKPLAYGNLSGIPFFGLPGNPVSAMVTFEVFVHPTLLRMSGKSITPPNVMVRTGEPLKSDGRRSYLRVRLSHENGQIIARTTGTQSSGALMSMVRADALLVVPENLTEVAVGTELTALLLRSINEL